MKKCEICNKVIKGRTKDGTAVTCDQKCAGKLAWETINK